MKEPEKDKREQAKDRAHLAANSLAEVGIIHAYQMQLSKYAMYLAACWEYPPVHGIRCIGVIDDERIEEATEIIGHCFSTDLEEMTQEDLDAEWDALQESYASFIDSRLF